jgi:hypothetical protein
MLRKILIPVIVVAGIVAAVFAFVSTASGEQSDLSKAKSASARFHSMVQTDKAGYTLLTDAAGIACIDMPGQGAMGIHFANGDLVGDPAIDPSRPEALVYAPESDGKLQLVALEYVVLKDAWDAGHSSPPSLFGQEFNFTDAPNRFGLPPFYSLHAWIWKTNPAGEFTMWNPDVSCPVTGRAAPSSTDGVRGPR